MPLTISNSTGDGVLTPMLQASLELPDGGTAVTVGGQIQAPGGTLYSLSGSPVTIPAPPGSGSVLYIIQANATTGVLSVKQDPAVMPAPDAGNLVVFSQTLTSTTGDPALDSATSTPDNY